MQQMTSSCALGLIAFKIYLSFHDVTNHLSLNWTSQSIKAEDHCRPNNNLDPNITNKSPRRRINNILSIDINWIFSSIVDFSEQKTPQIKSSCWISKLILPLAKQKRTSPPQKSIYIITVWSECRWRAVISQKHMLSRSNTISSRPNAKRPPSAPWASAVKARGRQKSGRGQKNPFVLGR